MSLRDENGNELTEEEHCKLVVKFKKSIKHSGGSDIIFYPEVVGFKDNATTEEIISFALMETPE